MCARAQAVLACARPSFTRPGKNYKIFSPETGRLHDICLQRTRAAELGIVLAHCLFDVQRTIQTQPTACNERNAHYSP